jgi:basic membrane lipoprotein Med (substrate-binding protein (PBP1-ABC) superfamily)
MRRILVLALVGIFLLTAVGCAQPSTPSSTPSPSSTTSPTPTPTPTASQPPKLTNVRLGVFIPGRLGDSPDYDKLADGAQRLAMRDKRLTVSVFEAGFDQSKWTEQLTSYAASGNYDVIYTSNESMGPMVAQVAKSVPNIKFIVNDSWVAGNDRIYCSFTNRYQQSYLYGYMMALVSTSTLPGANPDKKIGLIYGQHYTTMDDLIIPGIEAGAKAVDPAFELKSVMLGNWFDAAKAESLTNALIDEGVDVMGAVVGSALPGVLNACTSRKVYMVTYDTANFDKAPGVIVGSVESQIGDMVTADLNALLNGTVPWGKPEVFGAEKGYVSSPLNAPAWLQIPENVRQQYATEYNKVVSGQKALPVPQSVLDKINAAAQGS